MSRRVVVTGLGTTSPVGGDSPTTWSALVEGRSGVRRLEQEWAAALGTQIAAPTAVDPSEVLDRVKARRLDCSMMRKYGRAKSPGMPKRAACRFPASVASPRC